MPATYAVTHPALRFKMAVGPSKDKKCQKIFYFYVHYFLYTFTYTLYLHLILYLFMPSSYMFVHYLFESLECCLCLFCLCHSTEYLQIKKKAYLDLRISFFVTYVMANLLLDDI
jgi:hypothetical protein